MPSGQRQGRWSTVPLADRPTRRREALIDAGVAALGHATGDMPCTSAALGTVQCNPTPTIVSLPGGVSAASVTVGLRHTCITTTDGDVYCWGDNRAGQLGVPLSTTSTAIPQNVAGLPGPVTQLSADVDDYPTTCALAGGAVWCWGSSRDGGTGHDPAGDAACPSGPCDPLPRPVTTEAGNLANVEQMVTGRSFGCALRTDGTVWCWGADGWGSLGQGTVDVPSFVAVQVTSGLPAVVDRLFSDGGFNVFAFDGQGKAYGWGRNNYGSLGTGALGELLAAKGIDIFRSKGILSLAGSARQYVFQGVHMLFDGSEGRPWREAESRTNRLVFIGRRLDRSELESSFRACLVGSR